MGLQQIPAMNYVQRKSAQFLFEMVNYLEKKVQDRLNKPIPHLDNSIEIEIERQGQTIPVLVEIDHFQKGKAPQHDCCDPRYDGHEASAGMAWVLEDVENLPVPVLDENKNARRCNIPHIAATAIRPSAKGESDVSIQAQESITTMPSTGRAQAQCGLRHPEKGTDSCGGQYLYRTGDQIGLTEKEQQMAVDKFLKS